MSINNLSFNNIVTNLTCCTDQGYIVYGLQPDLEKKLYVSELDGGVGIMKMFNKTNIIVMVGGGANPFKSKDTLVLWDQLKKQSIIEIDMKEQIKNVLINKETIIAILEKKVCLFNWAGSLLDTKITYANEKGLCVINMDLNVIATLGTKKGEIAIWKPNNDLYKTIEAHCTNIEAIAISANGKLVASASETGTLIRIFDTETGILNYEFRRGSNSANINDICFNHNSTLLACSSGNGTIHIFDIYNDPNVTKNTMSFLSGLKSYLPKYFSSQWGFKQININNFEKSICVFDENNDLHVACFDGNYYKIEGKNNEFTNMIQGGLHINNK